MAGTPRKKSGKKGKGKKKANENDVMHNVDKAFYELQITDLNRKLARQRGRVAELEDTVTQLDSKLGKQNEDSVDIISYLKRNLSERSTEVADLQLKITNLTELNEAQQLAHEEQMEKCKEEYNSMQEQLMSKVKMLTGQLNALDDYRMHREELLQKFEEVQNELDAQELKFRKQIYEMEKKTVLGKANLKREMEEKMYNLATNYQKANQIRIAATSQRIVRENIALNNEMNTLIVSTNDLDYENLLIKQQFKKVVTDYQLLEEGHKKTLHQSFLQNGVIRELTTVNLKQKEIIDKYEVAYQKSFEDKRKLKELLENEDILNNNLRNLENRLNAARYSQRDLQTQLSAETKFRHHLELIIDDARLLIKSALFEHPELKQKVKIPNEENIFSSIIDMLSFSKADVLPPTPYGTVSSVSMIGPRSDLAAAQTQIFAEMKPPIKKINIATHLGASFEDFLKQHDVKPDSIQTEITDESISDGYAASCSEETLLSLSSEEQTSSANVDAEADADSKDNVTVKTSESEFNKLDEENMEEEKMDEEKLDNEKLDEENQDDDFDEPY